ncbi:MAG: DUF362 domain-containing protein [Chloroflexi bacterium]|nr:MAG: DUF362 domain-containing protein [Chloroflexota bacterium]
MRNVNKPKVILRHCETYDPARITQITGEGMDELGVRPCGRTMVKPNVVIAHKEFFPHAFTRPEFIDGLLTALQERGEEITELYVGERSGITLPTRYTFAMAGYPAVLRKHKVRAEYFDEGAQVPVKLKHPDALRDLIFIPEGVARCEFLVNAPKFKAHPWTKVTLALKNFIGIQDDAHRLIDHDHMLHAKIADLQEVLSPGFIAIDGIIAGERTMLTPTPYPLHLIIMGINPVAVDSVCTHILGLDPREVDHIRITAERGYGPINLDEIEITGDVSLEEAQERAANLQLTLERVDQVLRDRRSRITAYIGPPPDTYDYCWGGCPGSLFEAMQIIDGFQPGVYRRVRPFHIVIGDYQGEIDTGSDELVLFMGNCTRWQGQLDGESVSVPFLYTQRQHLNPYEATAGDVVRKMIGVMINLFHHRGRPFVRVKGCPVSVAENVLYVSQLGRVTNPYLHPKIVFAFSYHWAVSKMVRFWRALKRLSSGRRMPWSVVQ